MVLSNNTILTTGSGSGLGLALAFEPLNQNYEIRPGMANMIYSIHRFFLNVAQNIIKKQSKKY